jgi:hypothetical protein
LLVAARKKRPSSILHLLLLPHLHLLLLSHRQPSSSRLLALPVLLAQLAPLVLLAQPAPQLVTLLPTLQKLLLPTLRNRLTRPKTLPKMQAKMLALRKTLLPMRRSNSSFA